MGTPPPQLVSLKLAYAVAWVAERLFKLMGRKDSMLSTDGVFLSNAFKALDNSKARRELGWNPRPVSETVRDAVAWFKERAAQGKI